MHGRRDLSHVHKNFLTVQNQLTYLETNQSVSLGLLTTNHG